MSRQRFTERQANVRESATQPESELMTIRGIDCELRNLTHV